ncbi:hypothetical protein [Cupriavidus sp. TMH.W2]|uniref:hypothetical protein n=1 Tax=Cupriavidus sp. TMH.W2 TaxID=3434465 RepID=UPI003D7870E1
MVSPILRRFLHKIGQKYGHARERRRGAPGWRKQVVQSARTKENARTGKPVRAKFPFWKRVDKS